MAEMEREMQKAQEEYSFRRATICSLISQCDRTRQGFPYNLMNEAGIDDTKVNPAEFFEVLTECCTDRELSIVFLRYSYDKDTDKNKHTWDEIGRRMGFTRERGRQIILKVHRKLRARQDKFMTVLISEHKKLERENEALKKELDILRASLPETEKERLYPEPGDGINILELELSVRSYNCLHRAGINTTGDLKKCTMYSLAKIRNLGRKSLLEIVEKAKAFGIDIPEGTMDDILPGTRTCKKSDAALEQMVHGEVSA